MGPRLRSRGIPWRDVEAARRHLLQWGRGSGAAEFSFHADRADRNKMLQWGRGSGAAELTIVVIFSILVYPLQWGRGSGAAELYKHVEAPKKMNCFNGAAAQEPRNWKLNARFCGRK